MISGSLNKMFSPKCQASFQLKNKSLPLKLLCYWLLFWVNTMIFFFNRDLKPENILLDSLVSKPRFCILYVLCQNWHEDL